MELLGVPIVVNAQYFDKFTAARFDKIKHLQDLPLELEDSPSKASTSMSMLKLL